MKPLLGSLFNSLLTPFSLKTRGFCCSKTMTEVDSCPVLNHPYFYYRTVLELVSLEGHQDQVSLHLQHLHLLCSFLHLWQGSVRSPWQGRIHKGNHDFDNDFDHRSWSPCPVLLHHSDLVLSQTVNICVPRHRKTKKAQQQQIEHEKVK